MTTHSGRTNLADFETTTALFLTPGQARAIVNFAALFHEAVIISDTALGDNSLLLHGYREPTSLFAHVAEFIEYGVVRALCRSKVVVGDEILVDRDPSIAQIWEGWQYRDKTLWHGEVGFTTVVDPSLRAAYCRDVDRLLDVNRAVERYDPDVPKAAFRQLVREEIHRESGGLLKAAVQRLPTEAQQRYYATLEQPWFTNADLWRILKEAMAGRDALLLHAHATQACFADVAGAGQTTTDRTTGRLIASFNLELQRREPWPRDVDMTLEGPMSLEGLFERAPIRLQATDVALIGELSAAEVVRLRRKASAMWALARPQARPMVDVRRDYLAAVAAYWEEVLGALEEKGAARMRRKRRTAILFEDLVSPVARPLLKLGAMALVRGLGSAPWVAGVVGPSMDVGRELSVMLVQERSEQAKALAAKIPPSQWRPSGLLGLDPVGRRGS